MVSGKYQPGQQSFHPMLMSLYQQIRLIFIKKIPAKYRGFAREKAYKLLKENVQNPSKYDDIFFIQKNVGSVIKDYYQKNHAKSVKILLFLKLKNVILTLF